jgi:hypothetical protein
MGGLHMLLVATIILTLLVIAATIYVQYRLPVHTRNGSETWLLRILLAITGIGLGWLCLFWFAALPGHLRWIAFIFGFGAAHVPAFFVLYIKRKRGEYGSG